MRLTFRCWNSLQASDCRSVPKEWIEAEASVRSSMGSGKRVSVVATTCRWAAQRSKRKEREMRKGRPSMNYVK
jgi:hypothetical protein